MFTNILVPIDGSVTADHAMQKAMELAKMTNAKVTLLNVIPSLSYFQAIATPFGELGPFQNTTNIELEEISLREAEKMLEEAKATFEQSGIEVETMTREGHAAEEICKVADAMNADLIIMGRRGLGAVASFFLGSTSAKVVQHTHRSVLLIH